MLELIDIFGSIAPGARAPFAYMRSMAFALQSGYYIYAMVVGPRGMNPANASLTPQTNQQVRLIASTAPREATISQL
jgi:hypothetical protein